MSDPAPPTEDDVRALARAAGIPIAPDRVAVVAAALAGLERDFRVIVERDLDETAPAMGFEPRTRIGGGT
ncbi:MAG: hypothetical protein ACFBSD_12670 [Paracoccaceae bacterium]